MRVGYTSRIKKMGWVKGRSERFGEEREKYAFYYIIFPLQKDGEIALKRT